MKKIQKVISRTEKRVASLLLAMLFILTAIFSAMSIAGYKRTFATAEAGGGNNTLEVEGEQVIIRDDALHFIFRHWHTNWDNEATLQSDGDAVRRDQYDEATKRYFVMVEGYIIPHNANEMKGKVEDNKYTIVLVNQATGELVQASTLYKDYSNVRDDKTGDKIWPRDEKTNDIVLSRSTTPYLGELNKTQGYIDLKVKKLADVNSDGERHDTEKFCGISLSAGRGASTLKDTDGDTENDTIRIQYSTGAPTHIVKGHIFYSSWTKVVTGTTDERIIDGTNAEVDTAEVYTWKTNGEHKYNGTSYNYTMGDTVACVENDDGTYTLVDSKTADSHVVMKGDEGILKKLGLTIAATEEDSGEVLLTTFYSSHEGLHTNKTLVQSADGRYFLFDLEAWYIEGHAAQLGYVIDASGSMAGTSDVPSIVNIYVAIASRIGVLFDEKTGRYSYTHYDAKVNENAYHTHYFKTCSLPYYEVGIKNSKKTVIIHETKITRTVQGSAEELKEYDIGRQIKFRELDFRAFDEQGTELKKIEKGEGNVTTLTSDVIAAADLDYSSVSIYYVPTDAERREDMERFVARGSVLMESAQARATYHESKCWSGLVNEFGKEELCATISNTIGDDYSFTTADWDTITGLKGAAGKIGDRIDETYSYPQREKLIGYYEIEQQSYNVSNGPQYRRWYFNSIDVKENATTKIRDYLPPSATYTGNKSYATPEYFAKAVLQGNGGEFNFSNGVAITNDLNYRDLGGDFSTVSGWGNTPANFSGGNTSGSGFNLAGGADRKGATGFKLSDASTPTKGQFTISFVIEKPEKSTTANNNQWGDRDAEILYIGSETGDIATADFRLVREDCQLVLYHGGNKTVLLSNYTTIDREKSILDREKFTFTYDKDTKTVKFYVNGVYKKDVEDVTIDNVECIVFDPFDDGVTNKDLNKFCVDEIFVYDTALSVREVKQLINAFNAGKDLAEKKTAIDWDDVFLTADLLTLFMNPQNTAHVPLGVAAYNYYVFNPSALGDEFYPLAYWEGENSKTDYKDAKGNSFGRFALTSQDDSVLGQLSNYQPGVSGVGWYYLSHSGGSNGLLMTVGTSKTLSALPKNSVYDDNVLMNINNDKVGTVKDGKTVVDADRSTTKSYSAIEGETIPFYIDKNGNLRCFYTVGCSYVYELDDKKYVKTEALQRILAYFSAELSEKTPSSLISAVQFSKESRELNELVLLDWSSKPDEIAAMLSQKFGKGDAKGSNKKEYNDGTSITEYNFALTGGTRTDTGLESFFKYIVTDGKVTCKLDSKNNVIFTVDGKSGTAKDLKTLLNKHRRDDEDAPKFVIIFTDGADDLYKNEGKKGPNHPAYLYAAALQALDYTVIGMYLPAGSDPRNADGSLSNARGTTYAYAEEFLGSIVSTNEDGIPYVYASTDISSVAKIFEQKIIESINGIMSGYTVQDYIDPRFDLQTEDGTVWHLGADGSVTIESAKIEKTDDDGNTLTDENGNTVYATVKIELSDGSSFTYSADGGSYVLTDKYGKPIKLNKTLSAVFHLSGNNTYGAARDANLRYDAEKDMYYLIWENQMIQSSPIGSTTMMPVWSVEYWLVAKDDFLGGNAVLTSGNEENMNFVYHPADRSVDAYAKYAFDSWTDLSDSLRGTYDSDWADIWNDRTGTKKDSYGIYRDMWLRLTVAEQQAMVDQWKLKYPNANVTIESFTQGNDKEANGARIMFMIVQMNLKRTNVHDASSGTSDMIKDDPNDETKDKILLKDKEGNVIYDQTAAHQPIYVIDQFPSKGTPRIAVNVSPNSVYETDLVAIMYLGEVMSPVLVLNNMVENNPTNWYLNYLARYAYYLYPSAQTPLLDLLIQWNGIEATDNVKSFSVPYMYLPNYQYYATGEVIKTPKLNNAGTKAHAEDVLGLLTYHWTRIEGNGAIETSVVNETNMNPWERMEYRLTVEFTVFHVGDDYESFAEACKDVPILDATLIYDGRATLETLEYDRIKYLTSNLKTDEEGSEAWNGLVSEKETYKDKDGNTQERLAYQPTVWSADTKGATDEDDADSPEGPGEGNSSDAVAKNNRTIAALSEFLDIKPEKVQELVSEKDKFFNNDRTQQALFHYQPDVVGAELALELKVKAKKEDWDSLTLSTISLTLTREFAGNSVADGLKDSLSDYGEEFTVTFAVSKSKTAPVDGVYTLYAKATSITGMFDDDPADDLNALPVGDYSFALNAVDTSKSPRLKVDSVSLETEVENFSSDYFGLNSGLFGTSNAPKDVTNNIAHSSGNTICFGTTANGIRDYGSLISMIDISVSISPDNAKIVIVEQGGESNESFLYRVTNQKTGQSIVVSVRGGGSTTILVSRGTYTVTEISEWSWRYYSGAVIEASVDRTVEWWTDDDGTLQEPEKGYWQITQDTDSDVADVATITFGGSVSRAVVTYRHTPNYKGWLGGENYADFSFEDSQE